MFSSTFAKLAFVAIAAYTTMAKPTLPIPASGKYRIQSAATGLYMDAFNFEQGAGTPVIVQTLNEPLTTNQEWTVTILNGEFAFLQSTSSFVLDAVSITGGLVLTLDPTTASEFELIPVVGGVQICIFPTSVGCLASPSIPITQIPLQPLSNAENLTWIFQVVG